MNASNWYVQQWRDGVLHTYQHKGFTLKNVTTAPVKIIGEQMRFLIGTTAEAEEDVKIGDDARPMNAGHDRVDVTTKKSRAFSEVFEDDLDQMTADEMQYYRELSAMALGRVHDRTIVRELNQGTQTVGAYNTAAGLATILQAAQKLQTASVPWEAGQIYCAVDSVTWNRLMTFEQFSSSDYVGAALPYVGGGLAKSWNGINIFQLDDGILRENDASGQATCLMWHKSAMGFGYTRELTGTVVWDNRKDAWTHNMRMRIGAKKLLDKGIVKIRAKYDPADITFA